MAIEDTFRRVSVNNPNPFGNIFRTYETDRVVTIDPNPVRHGSGLFSLDVLYIV